MRGLNAMRSAGSGTRSGAEGASIDLMDSRDCDAESILEWSDEFIGALKGRLLGLRAGSELPAEDRDELKAQGLLEGSSGKPTALGEALTELIIRESWQEGGERRSFRELGIEEQVGSVLEIGCSSGWTLRSLGLAPGARRMGVDIDARALALGYRFSRLENQDCGFACCSAYSFPCDDESIDFLICRNTLTYLHQQSAVREMTRVLKPGGLLFLRFENVWYDLRQVAHAKTIRSLASRLRDLGLGLIHAAAGWQLGVGSRVRWGRAFVALPRLRKTLRACGCEITQIDESLRCPRFWGFATQTSLLARKAGKSSRRQTPGSPGAR
jgi:SAM-dependent methyltransferase